MIKQALASLLLLLYVTVTANQDENEEASADFLEFLAEVEETTGAGFKAWLDDDSNDEFDNNVRPLHESDDE